MKPKFNGIVAVTVFLSTLVLSGLYWRYGGWRGGDPVKVGRRPAMNDVVVPDLAVLSQIDRLKGKLGVLAGAPATDRTPVRLELFGHRSDRGYASVGGQRQPAAAGIPDHHLTLAFDAGKKKVCMIDSVLYAEGAVLADGAVIRKIESRRVLVEKDSVGKWLHLFRDEEK